MKGSSNLVDAKSLFLAAVMVLVLVAQPATAASEEEPPTLLGTSGSGRNQYIPTLVGATGRGPAFQGTFWSLDHKWPNTWSGAELDTIVSYGAVPFIEITTQSYDEFVNGSSGALDAMASTIADWAQEDVENRLLVAPFPEANLSQHPWGGDRLAFLDSYRKVVRAFRAAGLGAEKVRFVLALNGGVAEPLSYADFYPGDDFVDVVAFSKLNRNNPWRGYQEAFGRHIREIQDELTTTKPILVFQTGSVVEDGDRAQWLMDMFNNLKNEEQVVGAIYFNVEKVEGGKYNDYRIIKDGRVDPVVEAEYPEWSHPSEASWLFDGRMDAWEEDRLAEVAITGGFVDLGETTFDDEIVWLSGQGITQGCNPPLNNRFCPNDSVTRGQLAAFLVRALGLTATGVADFADDDGSVFEADIERLAEAGITRGCNPPANDRFCPEDLVSRGQMAAFLVRALDYSTQSGSFLDTSGSVYEEAIEKLAAAGVTRGCNPPANDRFCPQDPVSRGQMAAFLNRALASS